MNISMKRPQNQPLPAYTTDDAEWKAFQEAVSRTPRGFDVAFRAGTSYVYDVGDHEHRQAEQIPETPDQLVETARAQRIEPRGGLVEEEQLRVAHERAGHGEALLMGAAAQKFGMFLCVQDLTCPGASLIHSAGLAAHVPGVAAIESNARQYCPAANEPWRERFPGIFTIRDGTMRTSELTGPGLGAVR